jgi:hypothetical protein
MKGASIIFPDIVYKCNLSYRHPNTFIEIPKLPYEIYDEYRSFYTPILAITQPLDLRLGKFERDAKDI